MFHGVVACDESCCAFVDFFNFEDVALCVGVPDACSIIEDGVN